MRPVTPSSLHAAVGGELADLPGVAFALIFGSSARGTTHAGSDVDVALGIGYGRRPSACELGAIVTRLEEAAGRTVDVVILEDAPPGLAYRVFRDGIAVFVRDRPALVEQKARAILEYLDFQPAERALSQAVPGTSSTMIDHTILARQVAAVRDAAARIREVLPAQPEGLIGDRTSREIVTLNLFVALQECLSLAIHWLADEGREVPETYAGAFRALAESGVLEHDLRHGWLQPQACGT